MDIQKSVEEFEKLEGTDIMNAMVVNVLMNNYILEQVSLGKLKPNDEIPFGKYVEELNLQRFKPDSCRDMIEGTYIARDKRVAQKSEEDFIMECYLFHIQNVFMAYPKCSIAFGKDDFGLSKFIMGLYPLFKQIIKTEVVPIDIVPIFKDRKDESACYDSISKFLIAIKARGLRQGECVNRYVKDLPYIPYFVQRLLRVEKTATCWQIAILTVLTINLQFFRQFTL